LPIPETSVTKSEQNSCCKTFVRPARVGMLFLKIAVWSSVYAATSVFGIRNKNPLNKESSEIVSTGREILL